MWRYPAVLALVLLAAGCASTSRDFHFWVMRGQVVAADEQSVEIYLGSSGKIHVGQELEVFRLVRKSTLGRRQLRYDRVRVGVVRIDEIVHENFARARVVRGSVKKGNVTDLAHHSPSPGPASIPPTKPRSLSPALVLR